MPETPKGSESFGSRLRSRVARLARRILLDPILYLTFDRAGSPILKHMTKGLQEEIMGKATDEFYELLLRSMDVAFHLCTDYRKNIAGFKGRYLFRTADGLVTASAVFDNGDMKVLQTGIDDWDVRVTFVDAAALRAFLFSKDQDILNSLLKNEVEVDGNANYIYKFGFLSRDLVRRLGIQ